MIPNVEFQEELVETETTMPLIENDEVEENIENQKPIIEIPVMDEEDERYPLYLKLKEKRDAMRKFSLI